MRSCERFSGPGCRVPCFLTKTAGVALAAVGGLLVLIFIPIRMWLALLGLLLLAAGVALIRLS